jgi:1-acyl-sn-glycerol-3-phosphate acyltransferase
MIRYDMFRNPLAPRQPEGMSDEEARLSAILPPIGHVPPAAAWRDRLLAPLRISKAAAHLLWMTRKLAGEPLGSPLLRNGLRDLLADLGIELTVHGTERLSPDGQILMWNQTSHLDHLSLSAAIPIPFRSLYNVEVSQIPYYGEWLRAHGHFFLNRFDEAQWRAAVQEAAEWIQKGNTVLVSPEGTRSWDGHILPMKRGAFILAAAAQRPIVPIVVYGALTALPRGRFTVTGGRIELEFRPPISTDGYQHGNQEQLKSVVATAFRQALAEGPPSRSPRGSGALAAIPPSR